jgi:hypothetical protein
MRRECYLLLHRTKADPLWILAQAPQIPADLARDQYRDTGNPLIGAQHLHWSTTSTGPFGLGMENKDGPRPYLEAELDPSVHPPHERPKERLGAKVLIDATRKFEYPAISLPPMQFLQRVHTKWSDCGLPPLGTLRLPKGL